MITKHTLEEHRQSIAAYVPGGKLFAAKNNQDTNFFKLLLSFAYLTQEAECFNKEYQDEYNPISTNKFIDEWESALGIPDGCFPGDGTIEERKLDIRAKLASIGTQTAQDFIDLAEIYGITIEVETGAVNGTFPMTFPIVFYDDERAARHTIIIKFIIGEPNIWSFPYTFPIPFATSVYEKLQCLFLKLKPANCDMKFEFIDPSTFVQCGEPEAQCGEPFAQCGNSELP